MGDGKGRKNESQPVMNIVEPLPGIPVHAAIWFKEESDITNM